MKSIVIREAIRLEREMRAEPVVYDELVDCELMRKAKLIAHGPQNGRKGKPKRDWE